MISNLFARAVIAFAFAGSIVSATPAQAADTFRADPVHSTVVFRVKHMNISYCYGRFNKTSGTFRLDEANPAESEVDIQVAASSIDTDNEARDKHLRNADFFDVERHKTIRFQSKKTTRKPGGPFVVEGELTLHGVTKPLTVEIDSTGIGKGMLGEIRSGIETVFTVRRSEFGMDKMIGPVGDEVRLMVSLEGIKE
ncbi:MAG TPA: YceI family protein [Pirellulales bacterium]